MLVVALFVMLAIASIPILLLVAIAGAPVFLCTPARRRGLYRRLRVREHRRRDRRARIAPVRANPRPSGGRLALTPGRWSAIESRPNADVSLGFGGHRGDKCDPVHGEVGNAPVADVDEGSDAGALNHRDRNRGAVARATGDRERMPSDALTQRWQLRGQTEQRNMQGTFDVTRIPLGLVSDIEQRHVAATEASREFGDVDRLVDTVGSPASHQPSIPPARIPRMSRKPTASRRRATWTARCSVAAVTTTAEVGSTAAAARLPTVACTIVTLSDPGTWAFIQSAGARPSTSVAPSCNSRATSRAGSGGSGAAAAISGPLLSATIRRKFGGLGARSPVAASTN